MTETDRNTVLVPPAEHPPLQEDLSPLVVLEALEDTNCGHVIFDRQLRILHASARSWRLLGVSTDEPVSGAGVIELLSRSILDGTSASLANERLAGFAGNGQVPEPVLLRSHDGTCCLRMRLRNMPPKYFAATFEKLLDNGASAAAIIRDSITGLATRAYFESALQQALQREPHRPVSLFLLDLDRFKAVNDTLGHATGDRLLRLVAERLQTSVRKNDLVARLGGDEFAIIIEAFEENEPERIARRILDLVQRTYLIEGNLVNIGTSIGIALSPQDGTEGGDLLRNADLALYHSKASGKGTFHFFERSMEDRARNRRLNELELRKALALRQLELHYQAQVDSSTGKLGGFEALLRWRHPERGLISPAAFLPVAEEIGIIVPIGDWVLRTACREAAKWPANLTIAVNASPIQFDTGHFAESVKRALQSTGLPGERLEIEITEGFLLRNNDVIQNTLNELRAMKVRIAMDDFGTGYASLSQLAKFPFDKIKIDRSLAGFEGEDRKQRAIVRAITALGQSLGICTLAEGVENEAQLARLQMDGCTSVQGYLVSRPIPAHELHALINRLDQKQ